MLAEATVKPSQNSVMSLLPTTQLGHTDVSLLQFIVTMVTK